MITDYLKYIAVFFISILFQVIIFDNIYFGGYAHIFLYLIFILILPIEINRYLLMILGFLLGLSVDYFNNTLGLHAFATVTVSFLRPYILQAYAPRDGYDPEEKPRIYNYGYVWFLKYALTILLIHNFVFYVIEVFRFYMVFNIILKTVASSVITLVLIVISHKLAFNKKQ